MAGIGHPKLTEGERCEGLPVVWAVGVWLFFAQGAAAVTSGAALWG